MFRVKSTSSSAPNGGKPADGATLSSTTRRYSLEIFPLRSFGTVFIAASSVCIAIFVVGIGHPVGATKKKEEFEIWDFDGNESV